MTRYNQDVYVSVCLHMVLAVALGCIGVPSGLPAGGGATLHFSSRLEFIEIISLTEKKKLMKKETGRVRLGHDPAQAAVRRRPLR